MVTPPQQTRTILPDTTSKPSKPSRRRLGHDLTIDGLPVAEVAPPARSAVKSAGRVLEILELFEDLRRPARVGEIAERLQIPQSSTSVLLRSLVDVGYVTFDPVGRTFCPSYRISLMGAWVLGSAIEMGQLARLMDEVSRETGETVVISSRNGVYAQYIHVIQATNPIRFHIPVGARRLLVWSGAGFMLLRDVPEAEIRKLVRRTNAERPKEPRIDLDKVLANVDTARRQGFFVSRGLVTPGGGHIGVHLPPELDRYGNTLVLGVCAVLDNLDRSQDAILASMRSAIERCLRNPDPAPANLSGV
jgi:DNA-binding IclR family transcriptional regulator